MNGLGDGGERRVVCKTEACEQSLEGDAVCRMREFRAVEIETDGALGAVPRPFDPHESRISVDKAFDEPSAGDTVHPQVLACRPDTIAVLCRIEPADLLSGRMRLAVGIQCLYLALER